MPLGRSIQVLALLRFATVLGSVNALFRTIAFEDLPFDPRERFSPRTSVRHQRVSPDLRAVRSLRRDTTRTVRACVRSAQAWESHLAIKIAVAPVKMGTTVCHATTDEKPFPMSVTPMESAVPAGIRPSS
jgi:hypothetical protein